MCQLNKPGGQGRNWASQPRLFTVQDIPDGDDIWVVGPQCCLLDEQGTLQQRSPDCIMPLQRSTGKHSAHTQVSTRASFTQATGAW